MYMTYIHVLASSYVVRLGLLSSISGVVSRRERGQRPKKTPSEKARLDSEIIYLGIPRTSSGVSVVSGGKEAKCINA